jgi:Flp pilus assembly protein TadG
VIIRRIRHAITADRDSGAVAVLVAVLAVALFGAAALAIDVAKLSYERQNLQNTLDTAAQAGAYELPADPTAARTQALAFAAAADSSVTPANGLTIDFWCIVASTGAAKTVDTTQIPSTCSPGAAPYNVVRYPGLVCNTTRCAIPCDASINGTTCNTIRAVADKNVAFSFAPAIGIGSGQTGATASIACKGSCGESSPNPLDVLVIGDRTGSMSTTDRNSMVAAIKGMVNTMDPASQYVALGTIGKSLPTSACSTDDAGSSTTPGATWIPVRFSNDYQSSTGIFQKGLNCLPASGSGTDLASPMKAGARFLLGPTSPWDTANNIASLPNRVGTPRKVIIFETDGIPNEGNDPGTTVLATAGDIGSSNTTTACNNFKAVATNAKAQGILIVTVGFGDAISQNCTGSGSANTYLAEAASPDTSGNPSRADTNCATAAGRTAENSDGDFYFCAATGSEFSRIFQTAIGQITKSIRFVPLPG